MYPELNDELETLCEDLENSPDPVTDLEALARVNLANTLAEARRILRALAGDEPAAADE